MPIIGLTGVKGSGKDTIADYLVHNYGYIKVAFADFIKNALKELFDWNNEDFSQNKKEVKDPYWGVTPRKMCQEIGTEFLRVHCKDFISLDFCLPNGENYQGTFHIKRINKEITKLLEINKNVNIVFSDIRFQDELDYIKKIGGKIIRLSRNDSNKNEFSEHISEKNILDLKEVDYEISNNQTILLLFKKINLTVECIEEGLHQNHC
jgi:adenylate kinase family enzyme